METAGGGCLRFCTCCDSAAVCNPCYAQYIPYFSRHCSSPSSLVLHHRDTRDSISLPVSNAFRWIGAVKKVMQAGKLLIIFTRSQFILVIITESKNGSVYVWFLACSVKVSFMRRTIYCKYCFIFGGFLLVFQVCIAGIHRKRWNVTSTILIASSSDADADNQWKSDKNTYSAWNIKDIFTLHETNQP
jgi:hypothetical protein